MSGVNKVIILGNVGKDPEVRVTQGGDGVTNISVACTEKYKDKQGEQKEITEWVNVVFFGKLAEIAGKYIKKGSTVYVEGKLKTEKYTDKNGVEKYSTKVIASNMQLVGGKPSADNQGAGAVPKNANAGSGDIPDDDIPF
jgi:single-strand DNA-binding protein